MIVKDTGFDDLKVLKPKVFEDSRGCFFESYNKKLFEKYNLFYDFIQDNQSESVYGTIRGLHFQIKPYAQAKLVRVLKGKIIDVALDLRRNKTTFGKHFSIELSEFNKEQLLIPAGFAHGFSVISDETIVSYKIDNFYAPEYERAILFNDPQLNIDWKIQEDEIILSEKDELNDLFDTTMTYF